MIPADVARPRDARAGARGHHAASRCALGVVGLINIQFAVHGDDELYVIEANPRASRTVPFVSKAVGVPLAKLACRLMLGERLRDLELDLPARAGREPGTCRSRRPCCPSTASRAPTPCSARR